MAWYTPFTKQLPQVKASYKPFLISRNNKKEVQEQAGTKGLVEQEKVKFPSDLGEKHPFNFATTQGVYNNFGYVQGAIDKRVDFMFKSWYVKSDDKRATEIINQFNQDVGADSIYRQWVRQAFTKGNSFIELGGGKDETPQGMKVLNADNMYVERDNKGTVTGYNQFIGKKLGATLSKTEVIHFEPHQIAHLKFNVVDDKAYGLGIIFPNLTVINEFLGNYKDMHVLINRKANAPYHIQVGDVATDVIPDEGALSDISAELEWLTNKHEWVTDPYTNIKSVDFGNLGENFDAVNKLDLALINAGFQTPAVLMGEANIAEGLAVVQMEAYMLSIGSNQSETEKIVEEKIHTRILLSQGIQSHVEFEWGEPTETDKNARIQILTTLLQNPLLGVKLADKLQMEIARLLNIPEEEVEGDVEQREKEETQPAPKVPGTQSLVIPIQEGADHSLTEWLGFDYQKYKDAILEVTRNDPFDQVRAINDIELLAGKLNPVQIERLRDALDQGFDNESDMRQIAARINKKVQPQNLYQVKDDKIVKNKDGSDKLIVSAAHRSINIARSETTRLANQGALQNYNEAGIEKVSWVASFGARTCPTCEALNGKVMNAKNPEIVPPAHSLCRCSIIPVIE